MCSGAFWEDGVADNFLDVFWVSVWLFSLKHKTCNKLWCGETNWRQTDVQTCRKQGGFMVLQRRRNEHFLMQTNRWSREKPVRTSRSGRNHTCWTLMERWGQNFFKWTFWASLRWMDTTVGRLWTMGFTGRPAVHRELHFRCSSPASSRTRSKPNYLLWKLIHALWKKSTIY